MYSVQGWIVNSSGFVGHVVSIETTQHGPCSPKAAQATQTQLRVPRFGLNQSGPNTGMDALFNADGESNVTLIHLGFQMAQCLHRSLFKEAQSRHPSGILRIHFFLRSLKETKGPKSEIHSSRPISQLSNCLVLRSAHAKHPDSHLPSICPRTSVLARSLMYNQHHLSLSLSLSFHPPPLFLDMQLPLSTFSVLKSQSLQNLIVKDP